MLCMENILHTPAQEASAQAAAARAAELGLPEGSTWADIDAHESAQAAAARAAELGLPEGSTWADIDKHISAQEAEQRRIGGTALKALK